MRAILGQTGFSLSDSETETGAVILRQHNTTSDDQEGRRQLTLIDGRDWLDWSYLQWWSCQFVTCMLQNVSLQSRLSLKGILVKFFPDINTRDWKDMNVSRKFQSWKPGMPLLFRKLSGGPWLTDHCGVVCRHRNVDTLELTAHFSLL